MTFPLSDPLSSLVGSSDFNPDNWLAGVEQHPTPMPPIEGGRVRNEPYTIAAPPGAAASGGSIPLALDAAMKWAGTQYDWGGNGQGGRGVDCSGLIYAAFKSAGFNVERWRAVDYGHMGTPVDTADARPGDIVYFDNPNSDTDHVGIYLGGGKFLEAPQPGSKVQVSTLRGGAQIRRIFPDSTYQDVPTTPAGNYVYNAPGPSGGRYVAPGKGAHIDPITALMALDVSTNPDDLVGGLTAKGQLDKMSAGATSQPSPASVPAASSQGGQTVGQATGLSPAEAWIITHESDGQTTADNPTSTAYGFGQLLIRNRRSYGARLGFDPDTTDPGEQLAMFRLYVKERYGTAEAAQRFWEENGWY